MLCLKYTRPIELYVEKDYVSHQLPEDHREFSCILDLDNQSTGFLSLVQPILYINENQIFLEYNTYVLIFFLTINFLLSHLDDKIIYIFGSSNNLVQEEDMFNNMPTVDMNFGFDAPCYHIQNTMNYSSLQALNFDSRHFTPFDINQGSSEHPSAYW